MALAVARLITTKKALIAMSLACLAKLCRIMQRSNWGGLKESNLRLQSIQRLRTSVPVPGKTVFPPFLAVNDGGHNALSGA